MFTKRAEKGKKPKPDKSSKPKKERSLKPVKAKAGKKFKPSYRRGTRFVLFIGDEGTILLYIKGNVVLSRQFVPDASEQNLEELRGAFNKDLKAPLSLVIDSMDQSYSQQTLPPVSSMSVGKLIKRRMERDFGPNDIKGALMLGREETGRKDWNFLMVSIERSQQIAAWLDFVFSLTDNRIQGIYVVAVETEIIIKNLDRAMGVPKTGTGSKWKFFVSHNKVGGFRQVILRNGRILFTRMAQPIGESTPEVIAGNIEQEMFNTIEYMKRLSFDPQAGLDIYIIVSGAVKPLIDQSKFRASNFNILTPYEVAQYLGIEGATQPTDQFGDVVLAACISGSAKHILNLTTPESQKFDTLYNGLRMQRAAAALIVLGGMGYAASDVFDIYTRYEESGEIEQNMRKHQQNLDSLRAEIAHSNLDIEKNGEIFEQYQLLNKQKVSPLDFIAKVKTVLKSPIVVKDMEWVIDDKTGGGSATAPPKVTVVFTIQFPGVVDTEGYKIVSKKFMENFKENLKGFDASFTKVPSKYTETEKLDMNFDNPAVQISKSSEVYDVQLTIKQSAAAPGMPGAPGGPGVPGMPGMPGMPAMPGAPGSS